MTHLNQGRPSPPRKQEQQQPVGSDASLAWQHQQPQQLPSYHASPQQQFHHHGVPPPIHPHQPPQANYGRPPPMAHAVYPWQPYPPPQHMAPFPQGPQLHAVVAGGTGYLPLGFYPSAQHAPPHHPASAYVPVYFVPTTTAPALLPDESQGKSSKYPGKHVKPLTQPVGPPVMYPSGARATTSPPPHDLCVPSLTSPLRQPCHSAHDQAVAPSSSSSSWVQNIKELQTHPVRRGKRPQAQEAKSIWYSQIMNQQWRDALDRIRQGGETLDSERLHVILACLKDRDPCNYTNLGIALACLKALTATASQLTQFIATTSSSEEEQPQLVETKIYHALTKLVEWPVASRVLGAETIAHVFGILVVLLEDVRLRARAPPQILSKLSTVAASIWMEWNKNDTIVQLARRVLVAINPHYDDDDSEEDEEEHDFGATTTESPRVLQDTLPASVSTDNSVEWTSDSLQKDRSLSPEVALMESVQEHTAKEACNTMSSTAHDQDDLQENRRKRQRLGEQPRTGTLENSSKLVSVLKNQ